MTHPSIITYIFTDLSLGSFLVDYNVMFEVVFLRVTLSKPNRYVFLLKAHN